MKVLEVRQRDDGIKRRTYQLENGRKVLTYEVPAQVLAELGRAKLALALQRWRRIQERDARQDLIRERIREGIKPLAIADEFGVTEQRVRQIRKAMRAAK